MEILMIIEPSMRGTYFLILILLIVGLVYLINQSLNLVKQKPFLIVGIGIAIAGLMFAIATLKLLTN